MKRFALAFTLVVIGAVIWLVAKRLHVSNEFKSQEVVVYAYSSFVSSWGPGPTIAKEFETLYGAHVKLVDAGDSRLLPKKIEMEGDNLAADVVLGFDQFSLEAAKKFKWKSINLNHSIVFNSDFPNTYKSEYFIPFDWAPLTFIYRKDEIEPPKSIEDLKNEKYKKTLSLIDPRTSTPGYQFLDWIVNLYGAESALFFLRAIDGAIFSVSPGWSAAYGLFTKKQANLVFSYQTSVVYHWKEEKDLSYQAAELNEAHPYQIEFAAVPENCKSCAAGEEFVKFLLSKSSQSKIMSTNYMFPVIENIIEGTEFAQLPKLKLQKSSAVSVETVTNTLKLWKTLPH